MNQSVSYNLTNSSRKKEAYSVQYIVALVLLSVFIVLLNTFVVFLFATRDTLRSKTNKILVSLALVDIINGLVTIPLRISCNVDTEPEQTQRLLTLVLYRFVAASTMFHILTVTLERHICIVFPLRYNTLVTNTRIILALCSVWTFSMVYGSIGLSWLGLADEFNHLKEPPSLQNSKVMRFELGYITFGGLFCFFVPLLIMCYSFWKIIKEISRHNRRDSTLGMQATNKRRRNSVDKKPVFIFLAMMLLFVVNWSSWYVQLFILAVAPQHYRTFGGSFTEFLRFSASFIHPLLYSLVKKDFRQAVRAFLVQMKASITGPRSGTTESMSLNGGK